MMPFWIYTLGQVLTIKAKLNIPFLGLLNNLLFTIVPCLIGLGFTIKFPKLKKYAIKIAKPFTLISWIFYFRNEIILKYFSFFI